jgi:hypothetical protein
MRNPGRPSRVSPQNRLRNLLHSSLDHADQAYELFDEFLRQKSYNRNFCLRALAIARGRNNASWETRRLAILMLEHQLLKLLPDNLDEFDFLLSELKLKQPGLSQNIVNSVLREGFTTTELPPFIAELQNKLRRLNRVHNQFRGRTTSVRTLREFIALSRMDCKLSLARYLFTPAEVVDEILRQVRVTEGVRDVNPWEPRYVKEQMKAAIERLPNFEARVLKHLCETGDVYWVRNSTSSHINSLVEYPITTVVLVIKLPGSDVEFEIKRAGRKGEHSLNVVYSRNGYTVPPSHRLDGGSMQWLLRYEAHSGSKLGAIYQLVHDAEAPIGNYIARSAVYSIPSGKQEAQTLRYFTEPQLFGEGFRGMRRAMKESIEAFRREGSPSITALPGDLGLTAQYIGQVAPAQAIISGTTSFRLDKLANHLSCNGPDSYFKEGLKTNYSKLDAKLFADTLLEEVLGFYEPPGVSYQNHDQYVAAAFAVTENRVRADHIYRELIKQIAKFWGTLLGVRGYSRGESFVARNVGLKSVWNNGRWEVKIIFMDHDALVIPNSRSGRFFAHGDVPNMTLDERYIWERSNPERFVASEVGCLQTIYRVGKKLDEECQAVAQLELKNAYRKTQQQLMTNPEFQRLFSKGVVERIRDWDTLVDGYLQMNGDKRAASKWKKEMKKMLAASGYKEDMFDAYVATIEKNKSFLSRQAFLFDSGAEKHAKVEQN